MSDGTELKSVRKKMKNDLCLARAAVSVWLLQGNSRSDSRGNKEGNL